MSEKLPPEFVAMLEINVSGSNYVCYHVLEAFHLTQFNIEHAQTRANASWIYRAGCFLQPSFRHYAAASKCASCALPAHQKNGRSQYVHQIRAYSWQITNILVVDIYETAKTLQGILAITFEYPTRIRGNGRKEALKLPEVQAIVLIILATKLLFPFDDLKRNPATSKEPATQTINWHGWVQAQRQFSNHEQTGGQLGKEKLMRITDHDALGMNNSEIDQYMDWYEKDWLHDTKTINPIAEMFSTSRPSAEDQSNSDAEPVPTSGTDTDEALRALLQAVMADLKPVSMDPSSKALRPGSWYARYRWESQLPEPARAFYELGAQLASISLTTLVRAVSVAEWRVAKFLLNQRRDEYMMEWGMEEELEEDEVDHLDEQFSDLEV
jgi:RNA polymerase I-specific transcription initiation factor RRN7